MPELTWILDPLTGTTLVGGSELALPALRGALERAMGPASEIGCARPLRLLLPPPCDAAALAAEPWVRVAGYYHGSLVEGPGRRSAVLFAGCPLACAGCWVPQLHGRQDGVAVTVGRLADALLDPAYQRDGTSILGGEPFAQPEGLWALVRALRERGCPHILAYSGYTYEQLRRLGRRHPSIEAVLGEIEVLIDGRYVEALAAGAGPWTGSANQRVIDLVATRASGAVVILDDGAAAREAGTYGAEPSECPVG